MNSVLPTLEQRPPGGYLCICGQRQGAHDYGTKGMPSKDGQCAGFVLGEERMVDDIHAAHQRMSVERVMANCRPCGIAKIRWMLAQPESSHAGRNGRRLARIYRVGPK